MTELSTDSFGMAKKFDQRKVKRMKFLYLFFIMGFLSSISVFSQDTSSYRITAVTADGDRTDIEIISTHGDDVPRFTVWAGGSVGHDGVDFAGISYYVPTKHFFYLHGGFDIGFEGSLFFANWTTEKSINQSYKSDGYYIYKVSIEGKKRHSLGLHYGASYAYQWPDELEIAGTPSVKSFSLGLTHLRSRGGKWRVIPTNSTISGSKIVSLNADFVYYYDHDYRTTPEKEANYISEGNVLNYGGRFYLDGYVSSWLADSKVIGGIKYNIGVGTRGFKSSLLLIMGLGLSITF